MRRSRTRRRDALRATVEQGVDAERLRCTPAAPVDVAADVVAVHVPLDVGDVVVAQQRVEVPEQVLEHVGAAEVEHQLVAAEDRR